MPDESVKISLDGLFRLIGSDGRVIAVPGRHGPALLALLATADRMERGRDMVRTILWPRSPEAQSAGSLRTLLSDLRRHLGADAAILEADRRAVRLRGVALDRPGPDGLFYEDAPSIGEEFDDWLRMERARAPHSLAVRSCAAAGPDAPVVQRPRIALYPPRLNVDDLRAAILAERIGDQILCQLGMHDGIDIVDLSVLSGAGASALPIEGAAPSIGVLVSVTKTGGFAQVGVKAFDPETHALHWSASVSADRSSGFLFTTDQIDEFANQAVDSVLSALLRRLETSGLRVGTPPRSMFGAVHRIMSMAPAGQVEARAFMDGWITQSSSAVAMAWYAFSLANSLGEGGDDPSVAEAATDYCARALEADPGNALVLSLVGHVQGFVLRRLDLGAELCNAALRARPQLAIAWDLAAMNALYRGDLAAAGEASARAMRLGAYSPYRPLFQSSQMIGASLRGEHELAVAGARKVLSRIPRFLAVERHLGASLAALGRRGEAIEVMEAIRRRDPRFARGSISDPDYPLPSPHSVAFIEAGFDLAGYLN